MEDPLKSWGGNLSKIKSNYLLFYTAILFVVVVFVSIFAGRYDISVLKFLYVLTGDISHLTSSDYNVIFNVRVPRIIMVVLVGMSLSVSGAVFQSIFRNPLVSPDILGVSAGASFGAVLGLMLGCGSFFSVQFFAFVSGGVAVFAAYLISKAGKFNRVLMLILAGIIVAAFFRSMVSILKYLADPYNELPSMVFWTMGGFFRISWDEVKIAAPFMVSGLIVLFLLRWKLNIISLGDDEATVLGMDVKLMRKIFIFFATLIVASGISVCGTVGWVGLVVPHIARILGGPNHGRMVIFTGLLGAIFLLIIDNIARTLTASEIPVGILTSLTGAPFFCYIVLTKRKSGWV